MNDKLFILNSIQLNDLLIEPIQRIPRYKILLERILEYTKEAELVQEISDLEIAINEIKVSSINILRISFAFLK